MKISCDCPGSHSNKGQPKKVNDSAERNIQGLHEGYDCYVVLTRKDLQKFWEKLSPWITREYENALD